MLLASVYKSLVWHTGPTQICTVCKKIFQTFLKIPFGIQNCIHVFSNKGDKAYVCLQYLHTMDKNIKQTCFFLVQWYIVHAPFLKTLINPVQCKLKGRVFGINVIAGQSIIIIVKWCRAELGDVISCLLDAKTKVCDVINENNVYKGRTTLAWAHSYSPMTAEVLTFDFECR